MSTRSTCASVDNLALTSALRAGILGTQRSVGVDPLVGGDLRVANPGVVARVDPSGGFYEAIVSGGIGRVDVG